MEDKGFQFIVIAAVAVLIGLAFWSTIGGSIGTLARLQQTNNVSFATPTGATWFDVIPCGQLNTTNVRVFNRTGDVEISATSYNIRQSVSATDGYLITQIRNISIFSTGAQAASTTLNITCEYQPRGYIAESGGRNIALLIPIFFAILIAFAAMPDLREWLKNVVTK